MNRFVELHARLLEATSGCQDNMHEPDEAGLVARVVGWKLDNASRERISEDALLGGYQALVVILDKPDDGVTEAFNLADLIALARAANSEALQKLE